MNNQKSAPAVALAATALVVTLFLAPSAIAAGPTNAQFPPGLGPVSVHTALGGFILGYDIDETGAVGLLSEALTLGNGHHNVAGDAFVFLKPPNGWQTTSQYQYRIFASDGQSQDMFGASLSLSGKMMVAGAPAAQPAGAAYVFGAQYLLTTPSSAGPIREPWGFSLGTREGLCFSSTGSCRRLSLSVLQAP